MHGYRADVAFDGDKPIPGGALVLVEDGVITGVEPGSAPAPDDCEVTYLPGATLLPGLIDTHTHLCGNDEPDALDRLPGLSPDQLDETIEAALTAQLAAGVTAVRDLGDQQWAVADRHRHRPGGPTVLASGPPITSAGGHCTVMGGAANGAGELRRAVRERADRGADLVKIMTSGGVMTPATDIRTCQFTLEELRAVVEEAHRLGLAVTAHAHPLTAVEQCLAAGVDAIEHCSCLAERGMYTPPRLAAAIAAAGILVCPTLGHDLTRLAGPPSPASRCDVMSTASCPAPPPGTTRSAQQRNRCSAGLTCYQAATRKRYPAPGEHRLTRQQAAAVTACDRRRDSPQLITTQIPADSARITWVPPAAGTARRSPVTCALRPAVL